MPFDQTDRVILRHLQKEGRVTNAELASRIGISPPPTLERVRKLERKGVIKKYVAIVDPAEVGMEVVVLVDVTLGRHGKDTVEAFLEATCGLPEILEIHHVTGDADFMLKVVVRNLAAYEDFVLHTLTALPNIQHLKSTVVLSTFKNETALQILDEEPIQ